MLTDHSQSGIKRMRQCGLLLERWRRLPTVDPAGRRRDVDIVIDQGL